MRLLAAAERAVRQRVRAVPGIYDAARARGQFLLQRLVELRQRRARVGEQVEDVGGRVADVLDVGRKEEVLRREGREAEDEEGEGGDEEDVLRARDVRGDGPDGDVGARGEERTVESWAVCEAECWS